MQLTYHSRTQGSFKNLTAYTMRTSKNSVTVFVQRSCNEVFITQVTNLCWQLSVVRASSQMVLLRCCGQWRRSIIMQCVSWIVQNLAEQPVVGLIQQLLKVRQIRRAEESGRITSAYLYIYIDTPNVPECPYGGKEAILDWNTNGDWVSYSEFP